jgi:hypothetical protein
MIAKALILLALPCAVEAAPKCGPRAGLVAALADRYEEHPVQRGVTAANTVLEVFASESGSWTIVISDARGLSCLMASGEHWGPVKPLPAGDPL